MEYNEIKIGSAYSFKTTITRQHVLEFAEMTGDKNKIHIDEEFGKTTVFKRNIAHGMLVGSFFSTLVGMHCPGENSLYLSQTLNFKKPIFFDDAIVVRGTVLEKNDSIQIITLKTEILKEGIVCISGDAKVKVL